MVMLNLERWMFKDIQLHIDMEENMEVELESEFSMNLNYNEDNTICIAEIIQEVAYKKKPSVFQIKIIGVGHFSCEGLNSDEDKKQAHVIAYNFLFPYVQSMISNLTVNAGFPPLMIRRAKMDPKDIKLS